MPFTYTEKARQAHSGEARNETPGRHIFCVTGRPVRGTRPAPQRARTLTVISWLGFLEFSLLWRLQPVFGEHSCQRRFVGRGCSASHGATRVQAGSVSVRRQRCVGSPPCRPCAGLQPSWKPTSARHDWGRFTPPFQVLTQSPAPGRTLGAPRKIEVSNPAGCRGTRGTQNLTLITTEID